MFLNKNRSIHPHLCLLHLSSLAIPLVGVVSLVSLILWISLIALIRWIALVSLVGLVGWVTLISLIGWITLISLVRVTSWTLLHLHLTQLIIIEVIGQSKVGVGHYLRRPTILKHIRHSICSHNGENNLNKILFTMGIELPTRSEQH
jgi:hypothetical protein